MSNMFKKLANLVEEHPEAPKNKETPGGGKAPKASPKAEAPGPSPKQNRALIIYVSLLFTVAFAFVLVSLFIQARNNTAAINNLTQSANNSLAHAEQLQEENRQLLEDNRRLLAEMDAMKAEEKAQREEMDLKLEQARQDLADAADVKAAAASAVAQAKTALSNVEKDAKNTTRAYELLLQAQDQWDNWERTAFEETMTELEPLASRLAATGKAQYEALLEHMPQE